MNNNWCAVTNCRTNFYDKKPDEIMFHKYPTNDSRLKLWTDALKNQGRDVILQRVCSRHFLRSDYYGKNARVLKKFAVPSLELFDDKSDENNDEIMTLVKVDNKKICIVEQCNHSSDGHSSCSFIKYPKDEQLQSLWTKMLR